MLYRREIDGLRALAVLPVILYHAGFEAFSGGYVGVDVFFVISGYLITSIIYNEKLDGTFSLTNFYERRARRILPALFFVLAMCLPFAWLWLLPQDLKKFSGSLAGVALFISNHFFSNQSAYFDAAAELKPLLHTWSLAVEEQYYLFFPTFIMLTWKLGARWILGLITAIALISLGLAQWMSIAKPTFAFFLLPTRAWELLIGAMTVFYFTNTNAPKANYKQQQLGSILGLGLLIYAIFAYDNQTPFPSLYTLAPTVGAALIILFATPKTWVGKLLGIRLLVGIGLVSYSAYLWHQPILAFARHQNIINPSQTVMGALATLAFLLAYLSWRFIEIPFRNKKLFSRNFIFCFFLAGSLFFIIIGLFGNHTNGFTERSHMRAFKVFENDISALGYRNCEDVALISGEELNHCLISPSGTINAAVIGDSHADDKFYGFTQNDNSLNWMLIGNSSCPPLLGVNVLGYEKRCLKKFEKIIGWLNQEKQIHTVVLLSYWGQYPLTNFYAADHLQMKFDQDTFQIKSSDTNLTERSALFHYGLTRAVRELTLANKQVIILMDIPELPYFPLDCIKRRSNCVDTFHNVLMRQVEHRESLRKIQKEFNNVRVFDPTEIFCDSSKCSYERDGVVLYRDSHHLTLKGSEVYGKYFSDFVRR